MPAARTGKAGVARPGEGAGFHSGNVKFEPWKHTSQDDQEGGVDI